MSSVEAQEYLALIRQHQHLCRGRVRMVSLMSEDRPWWSASGYGLPFPGALWMDPDSDTTLASPCLVSRQYTSARCMRHSAPYPAPAVRYHYYNPLPPQRHLRLETALFPPLGRYSIRFHWRTSLSDLSISSPLPQVTTDPAKSPVRQSTSTPPTRTRYQPAGRPLFSSPTWSSTKPVNAFYGNSTRAGSRAAL